MAVSLRCLFVSKRKFQSRRLEWYQNLLAQVSVNPRGSVGLIQMSTWSRKLWHFSSAILWVCLPLWVVLVLRLASIMIAIRLQAALRASMYFLLDSQTCDREKKEGRRSWRDADGCSYCRWAREWLGRVFPRSTGSCGATAGVWAQDW